MNTFWEQFPIVSYSACKPMHLNMYLDGLLKIAVYVVVYMGWSLFFKPEAFVYATSVIPQKMKFWERNRFHK